MTLLPRLQAALAIAKTEDHHQLEAILIDSLRLAEARPRTDLELERSINQIIDTLSKLPPFEVGDFHSEDTQRTLERGLGRPACLYLVEWAETHYEVIERLQESEHPAIEQRENERGRGGMWELAFEITQAFVDQHQDRDWNGDWFDTLDAFVPRHLDTLIPPNQDH